MADGGGAGSHRDARTGRPRVQQLRPTNKDASTAAAGSPASRPAGGAPAPTAPGASWEGSAAGGPRVVPRIVTGQGSGSTIIVNSCQRGNPLLKHIRNIGWEYGDIVPDYQVGAASCALFLSLRYHRLHPEYIHNRIQKLGNMFSLRILLVICDVDQHQSALKELTKVALVNNLTLMVAWTSEEAGSYLERYKTFERAAPDLIRERVSDDYMSQLTSALTSIKSVNKTDVVTLATNFGSLKRIAQATSDELSDCPGMGGTKTRRLQEAFRQPFRVGETRTRRERMAMRERAARRDQDQDSLTSVDSGPSGTTSGRGPLRPRVMIGGDEDEEAAASLREAGTALAETTAPTAAARATAEPSAVAAASAGARSRPAAADDEADLPDEIEDADADADADAGAGADDGWDDVLDHMTEEERLQLAMEMSISGAGNDGGGDGDAEQKPG